MSTLSNPFISPLSKVSDQSNIGSNCHVEDFVVIAPQVSIGNNVRIQSFCYVTENTQIADHVSIGPHTTFINRQGSSHNTTIIETGVVIQGNSTLLSGIHIGPYAYIKAGTTVMHSVPPYAIVSGNPAHIVGYVKPYNNDENKSTNQNVQLSTIKGVTSHHLPLVEDLRGNLSVGEFPKDIPFAIKRYFIVFDVPNAEIRGEHAHRQCHQFLICIKGSCNVIVDDGENQEEFILDSPNLGLYLPPMIWGIQYKYSPDAVLLVFASELYNNEDYIRDYQEFKLLTKNFT